MDSIKSAIIIFIRIFLRSKPYEHIANIVAKYVITIIVRTIIGICIFIAIAVPIGICDRFLTMDGVVRVELPLMRCFYSGGLSKAVPDKS